MSNISACIITSQRQSVANLVNLLELQTIRPDIIILYTGEKLGDFYYLKEIKSKNIIVQWISPNYQINQSDAFVCALEFAISISKSDYVYITDMTCLPKATCSLEYMMSLCSKKNVCGYSLIDKTYPGHKSMVGFKSLMVKKDLFAKHNISFNLRKLSKRLGLRNQAPTGASKDYLSREVMFNLNLKDNKISPFILGEEGYSKSDKVFGFYDDKDKMQHDSDLMLSYADTTSPQWDHNSKIQMFCMYSQSHEKLYHNVYMKSLNEINDPDIELKPLFIDHYSNGDFTSQGFADMDLYKTQIIINLIKSNYGKVIVFSDADIYWFKPFSHTIKFLMMQNYDCLYTKESNNEEAEDKANIGISVIKCSEKTEKFYKDIYDFYEKVYCSLKEKNLRFQGIVNTLLPKSNLKWCMLPSVFANSSLEYDINDDRLICYHSIGTFPVKNKSSVELKLEQFQKIKKR